MTKKDAPCEAPGAGALFRKRSISGYFDSIPGTTLPAWGFSGGTLFIPFSPYLTFWDFSASEAYCFFV